MKAILYLVIGILSFVIILKIFWPLIWVVFIVYIGYSVYQSFIASKKTNATSEQFYRSSNKKESDDIIDVEYTEVVEENNEEQNG